MHTIKLNQLSSPALDAILASDAAWEEWADQYYGIAPKVPTVTKVNTQRRAVEQEAALDEASGRNITAADVDTMIDLNSSGMGFKLIGERYGVGRRLVSRILTPFLD